MIQLLSEVDGWLLLSLCRQRNLLQLFGQSNTIANVQENRTFYYFRRMIKIAENDLSALAC
jgi:hypothetical protein